MKRALILTNAYSSLPAAQNQSERLKEELLLLGVHADVKKNSGGVFVDGDGHITGAEAGYDFCIYLDKDKYASAMLEKSGLRLFNSHAAIRVCDDKMKTHVALSGSNIAMPATIPGLLCYDPHAPVRADETDFIERTLGYPVIVKESYGSLGKGVYMAENRDKLIKLCEKLKCTPHLFQQCIKNSLGKDTRVIVIGGKAVAAMHRTSCGDFRSNLGLGGKGLPAEIDGKLRDICERTAKTLSLDYCGIDILSDGEKHLVCEVNSNAFFSGIESVTGVNIARLYAQHICREIYG